MLIDDKNLKKHLIDLEEDIKEYVSESKDIKIQTCNKILTFGYYYSINLLKKDSYLLNIEYTKLRDSNHFHLKSLSGKTIKLETNDIYNHKETILQKVKEILDEN